MEIVLQESQHRMLLIILFEEIKTESRTEETVQVTAPPPHVPVHVPLSENLLYALDDSCFTEDQINTGDDGYSVGCEQQHHYVGEDDDVHITHSILSGFLGDDGAASSCLLQETDFDGGSFDFEDCDSFSMFARMKDSTCAGKARASTLPKHHKEASTFEAHSATSLKNTRATQVGHIHLRLSVEAYMSEKNLTYCDDGAASSCLLQETDFDSGSFDFEDCDSFVSMLQASGTARFMEKLGLQRYLSILVRHQLLKHTRQLVRGIDGKVGTVFGEGCNVDMMKDSTCASKARGSMLPKHPNEASSFEAYSPTCDDGATSSCLVQETDFDGSTLSMLEDSIDARLALASLILEDAKEDVLCFLLPKIWLCHIYKAKGVLQDFVNTIIPLVRESLYVKTVRPKADNKCSAERISILNVQENDDVFGEVRPLASKSDLLTSERRSLVWSQQEYSNSSPTGKVTRDDKGVFTVYPNDSEARKHLLKHCLVDKYSEALEIINLTQRLVSDKLPGDKEELLSLLAQTSFNATDPKHGFDSEASYNIARAYHHVGLVSIAASHYEKVPATCEKDYPFPKLLNENSEMENMKPGYCDLCREAAYNLHLIYKNSGAFDRARQVLKDHCTF
ncbi:unnamed protein product [Dovyalis caffra]|uniref:Uncharacterized protein n=1 Tax=Dovyalis caffra TaxID=77055 RepID=A0AAV1RUN8_9ROSI|nr:unnamed protein product [Dovyalis caffra]